MIARSLRREVIVALRVFDDYTLKPIESGLQFWVDDEPYVPLRKQDGIYVFMQIDQESFELKVSKPCFFDHVIQIRKEVVNPLDELMSIRLRPTPQYPFKRDSTLVRFKVTPEVKDGKAAIKGYITDASYYHGRLTKNLAKSHVEMTLASVYGSLQAGDMFYLEGEEGSEFIALRKVMDKELVLLEKPVRYTYKQGLKIYKATITQTDSEGYGVMYVNGLHRDEVNLKLSIETKSGYKEVDVLLKEGKAVNLGIINIERRE